MTALVPRRINILYGLSSKHTSISQAVVEMKKNMNRVTLLLTILQVTCLLEVVQCADQEFPLDLNKIRLDDLSHEPFKQGPAKVVDHYHTFFEEIPVDAIEKQIGKIKNKFIDFINNPSLPETYFSKLEYKIIRFNQTLGAASQKLNDFKPIRAQRDLSRSSTFFSKNLNHEDVLKSEENLKLLQKKELSGSLTKNVSSYKGINLQLKKFLNDIATNQEELKELILINDASETEHYNIHKLSYMLDIMNENIHNLISELNRLYDCVYSNPKNAMSLNDLITMYKQLKNLYKPGQLLKSDVRYYHDLISIESYMFNTKIVISSKFPIMNQNTYDLYSLDPVHNKNHLIINPGYSFMVNDTRELLFMKDKCPKIENWYICKPEKSVSLLKESFLKLDDQHYLLFFSNETKANISCAQESFHQLLKGIYLATIPHNCSLSTSEFTIANNDGKHVNNTTLPNSTSVESFYIMLFVFILCLLSLFFFVFYLRSHGSKPV